MKIRPLPFLMPVAAVLLLLVMACSEQAADSTPDSQNTGSGSELSAASRAVPTPVPVSSELVSEFAAAQDSINADWDELHVDFDRWRANLNACDRTAAIAAMREFASDFGEIAGQARDLPGKGIARELPDNVIMAANGEEASLRLLRDIWLPGDVSLLENTQTERATAAGMIRATAIEVDKLEELDKPEDQEVAEDFADALEPVDEAWDAFNDSYEALEDDHIDLDLSEIVTRLRALVDEHEAVLESLEDIPSDKVSDPVQDPLIEAAEAESDALGDLLDAFRKAARDEARDEARGTDSDSDAEASNGAVQNGDGNGAAETSENGSAESSEGSSESSEEGTDGSTGAPQGTAGDHERGAVGLGQVPGQNEPSVQGGVTGTPTPFTGIPAGLPNPTTAGQQAGPDSSESEEAGAEEVDYSEYFDTFEDALDQTRTIRKQAERDLEAIIEGVSEEDKEALAEFTSAFSDLMDDWDRFHAEFDKWVRTEGDCNRASAVEGLNGFNQEFSELSNRVRELSQVSYLRPSSDLLAEAVDREGAALRGLASTWAPYESDVYRGLDDERANAANLRRLADRRTQELIERNGLEQ